MVMENVMIFCFVKCDGVFSLNVIKVVENENDIFELVEIMLCEVNMYDKCDVEVVLLLWGDKCCFEMVMCFVQELCLLLFDELIVGMVCVDINNMIELLCEIK